uniref:Bulb-type lectin domain-containing protein n=1 Tax=Attheya septentrionalis TaxID=420275 RepID=A0A7S2ULH6_9STRA|mmetsp:Transcript_3502/g.6403  ORF Transcript_3502/g.6403 Transcript_3502/m.6403 type:complete len:331 (+) Transcript_3502:234-1226(+)
MKYFHLASLMLGSMISAEVIMKRPAEDGFPDKLHEGEFLSTLNDDCRLQLNGDGNLVVRRYVSLDSVPGYVPVSQEDEYDKFRTAWSTGAHGTGDYVAKLQGDGNFVVYGDQGTGSQAMFKTRSNIPQTAESWPNPNWYPISRPSDNFTLAFGSYCSLSLRRYYEAWENGNADSHQIWENLRYVDTFDTPTSAIVQKGEMFRGGDEEYFCPPPNLMPQDGDRTDCVPVPLVAILKQNCNFEIHIGHDMADAMTRVWTTNTPRTDLDDCYFYAFDEGPALVEGAMHPLYGTPDASKKYWSIDVNDISSEAGNITGWYQMLLHTTGLSADAD